MTNPQEERRKFRRFEFRVEAEYRHSNYASRGGKGFTGDFSREGLRFYANEELSKGTVLDLSFIIPGESLPVAARGEVMWCVNEKGGSPASYSIGIRLIKIKPEDKLRVLDYAYNNWVKNEFGDVGLYDLSKKPS